MTNEETRYFQKLGGGRETKGLGLSVVVLAGYYRRFVPHYIQIAAPLTDLTKKKQPNAVQWTEKCQKAFNKLKATLMSDPVLRAPDFDKPFLVTTDVSERGVGAVLMQKGPDQESHRCHHVKVPPPHVGTCMKKPPKLIFTSLGQNFPKVQNIPPVVLGLAATTTKLILVTGEELFGRVFPPKILPTTLHPTSWTRFGKKPHQFA
ncbi:unnamed protein product [Caretta caretta]